VKILILVLALSGCSSTAYLPDYMLYHGSQFRCPSPLVNVCTGPAATYCTCQHVSF